MQGQLSKSLKAKVFNATQEANFEKEAKREVERDIHYQNIDRNVNWFQIETEIRKQVTKTLAPFQKELNRQHTNACKRYVQMDNHETRLSLIDAYCRIDASNKNQQQLRNMIEAINEDIIRRVRLKEA